jgi:hypothetical protein
MLDVDRLMYNDAFSKGENIVIEESTRAAKAKRDPLDG